MSRAPRILMVADVAGMGPHYHVGDEAMAQVAIDRLKEMVGDKNLMMACSMPEGIASTYGIRAIPFYNMTDRDRAALRRSKPLSWLKSVVVLWCALRWCDLVFVCGGGNITSVWPDILESRLHLLRQAVQGGKDFVLASQTLGPFSEEHRAAVRDVLRHAKWIGVRDPKFSAEQVGLPVHYAVDDAAFLQPGALDWSEIPVDPDKCLVGVSLRQFKGVTEAALGRLARFVAAEAKSQEATTVFIPHHAPYGGGDLEVFESVKAAWSATQPVVVVAPTLGASKLKSLTGRCRWVVTMRYHQLIFALAMGVPAIGVYSDQYTQAKLTGAFLQFSLDPIVLHIDSTETEWADALRQARGRVDGFRAAAEAVSNAGEQNMRPYHLAATAG